ncbi:hypothetical protein GH714_029153 [Hevea brasiliensis]|uniref:Pectate lyase n=1 Tax=Hevea brasiliensis TaxID=3981 RepID=A0A6A6KW71_HEVBR|nr:hypothetical protein GH714_029153 [Hevea brasiliensis]
MAMPISLLFLLLLAAPSFFSSSPVQDPELVVEEVHRKVNASRRNLGFLSCGTGNPIDDCWRCDSNWKKNRQRLADCAIGFGKHAIGGRDGKIYVVTDSVDDDPVNPKPGTLRYAVIQDEPVWIVFARDMVIKLKEELIMNSFKTIDGRGASVHIAGGPCITMQYVTNIIIQGLNIHDCKQGGNTYVRDSLAIMGGGLCRTVMGYRSLVGVVWIDHCSLSNCHDGLINAIHGSTAITISNNYLTHHNKVMLLGHSDSYTRDKNMQVTIAFNHFGEGLVQRMPSSSNRSSASKIIILFLPTFAGVDMGTFHVVNNDYSHWEMYAIGGSAAPTINSQGNRFLAPNDRFNKEVGILNDLISDPWSRIVQFNINMFTKFRVTKHEDAPESERRQWNWRSEGDLLLNGAFFTPSGAGASSNHARASSLGAIPSSLVSSITAGSGALFCKKGKRC